MQPGKPQGFGVVGEDETPIFTLPGNPVSSYVSFEVFVLPAIRAWARTPPHHAGAAHARHLVTPRAGGSSCGEYAVDRGGPTVAPSGATART